MGIYLLSENFNRLTYRIFERVLFCILFSGLFLPQLFCQELIIRGKVIDKTTNQILSSVSVHDKISLRGTTTDDSGYFKISFPPGEHNLEFSYTGYVRFDTTIYLSENVEIYIYLNSLTVPIGEITISAEGIKDHVSSPLMGSFTLTNKEMKKLPSLLGETDPLKLLQLTPGVQGGSEGNMGFYVRGGGTDQNLILYDNTLIYNPGHLLGFFSIFNPEIIRDVSIIKSGIPAQYGGKLSSVIKINSYKGNKDSVEVMGSIGLISSRISISVPLFKGNGTIILGARRTYLELLVEPIVKHLVKNTSFFNEKSIYNFNDFNAGASLKIANHDNISFSGYIGRDNFRMGRAGIKQKNSIEWGNSMASLLWKHEVSAQSEWNTNISWTKYKFDLSGSQADYFFGLLSSVEDYSLKSNYSLKNERKKITTGFELTEHSFIPNRIDAQAGNFLLNFGQFSSMNALEGGIFFDEEVPLSSRITIAGGFRFSFFNHHGPYSKYVKNTLGQVTDTLIYPRGKSLAFFSNPEPRLVIKFQINDNISFKASYMRIAQYIHLATSATASLPTDIWIPSTSELKPMTGDQLSIGYFRNFPKYGIEFSTETYYKKMNNQLEFLRGVVYNSIYGTMEDNIATGFGQSYGVEFYLRKKTGKYTGWLSYTLSRTEQKFDEINSGLVYPSKYDRRHEISLVFIRKLNEKWNGSAVFIYLSGNAFTMPAGRYIIQGNIINQYGVVNSFRMPPYHRMDISFTRKTIIRKNWSSELTFSIYNIYNRANPYFIYFEAVGDLESYSLKVRPVIVSLFPVIPSVSWSFKF
jgi:hypothetical protein